MRRGTSALRRPVCAFALTTLALSGCATEGLAFRVDDRLEIVAPPDESTVRLPVTVDWEIEDFDVVEPGAAVSTGRDSGYFAVFVDRAPQPPGEPLSWVARDDGSCREQDGCPDPTYLAAAGIYATKETEIVLEQLPPPPSETARSERHAVTVILLDAGGKRIGESAFQVDFTLDRDGS